MPKHGLLFAFSDRHGIIQTALLHRKEHGDMTDRRTGRKQAMSRILALVIAGVMTLTVILAVVLK